MKCGSPGYIAPEILRSTGYNQKADIFSLGALFYSMITSMSLFPHNVNSKNDLIHANARCNLAHVPKILADYPPGILELLSRMLAINPADRPTAH